MQQVNSVKRKYTIFYLLSIIILGLGIRFYIFPFEVPIATDGYFSFVYAVKTVFEQGMPSNIITTNTGWSNLLSTLFFFTDTSEPMHLMQIQRSLSVFFSVATTIPTFFLLQRFVNRKFALSGALLIAIEPRLLLLSIEGVNFSLYVFLVVLAITLFFKKTNLGITLSFICISCATLVRYEAMLLLIPFASMYLIRFKTKKSILKLLGMLIIFCLIILPFITLRMEATEEYCYVSPFGEICGFDGIISNFFNRIQDIDNKITGVPDIDDPIYNVEGPMIDHFIFLSLSNFIKFFGLILIPIFIFSISIGIFILIKKRKFNFNFEHKFLIFCTIVSVLPGLYAYGRGIEETKYVLIAIPLLCLISAYSIKFLSKNRVIFIVIIFACILTSGLFIEYEKKDNAFEYESYIISKKIEDVAKGVNPYEYAGFVKNAKLEKQWNNLSEIRNLKELQEFDKVSYENSTNLEQYIKNSDGRLTHIVVYEQNAAQPKFLEMIFREGDEIKYLELVFDSKNSDFQNAVKIFRINYDLIT